MCISFAPSATMVALGANEIHMGPMAHLSAVDTSLTHDHSPIDRDNDRVSVSLDELTRVVKLWRTENNKNKPPYPYIVEYVHPLVMELLIELNRFRSCYVKRFSRTTWKIWRKPMKFQRR